MFIYIFALIIGVGVLMSAKIYINMGMVRAFCPNGYCSPIPNGMSGIAFSVKYPDKTEDEKMVLYCNALYPLPCDSLD